MKWEIFGKKPLVGKAYIDITAVVVGEVVIGDGVGVFPNTTIRGDDDRIVIEKGAMILDNCVIEAPKGYPVYIGERAIVSHGAVVHGAIVGRECIIGTGAIVLDGSKIGENSLVAAGAVVPPETTVPDNSVVAGVPGKIVRTVDEKLSRRMKKDYESLAKKFEEYRKVRGILSGEG